MSRGTPETAELFRLAIRQAQHRVRTSIPGYVEKVHTGGGRNGQWVDVLPAIRVSLPGPDGVPVEEDLPKLTMVPVGHTQGGGFFVSVPLKPGDHVLLQFCERSLDQWVQKAKRGRRQAVSPGHSEIHGLNGAVALPVGPATIKDALQDVHPDDMVLGRDGSEGGAQALIRIRPDGSVVIDAPTGLEVNGDLTVNGDADVFGDVAADGDIGATGGVSADGEVTAGAIVPATAVKVTTHQHVAPMGPTSPPTPGT